VATEAARVQGGLLGGIKRAALTVSAVATFARMYCLPATPNSLPVDVRVAPAW
jgi:magnesium-protoporphyrin IX monomethyl ester (oxidative) cyclase